MRRAMHAAAAAAGSLIAAAPARADGGARPAGGAALGEVVLASAGAMAATTALVVLGLGHRTGRFDTLSRAAAWTERRTGMPGWAALPTAMATVSLITALVGMYWDIALHIDVGRDEGPLANPAHYLILVGLFGIFAAGFVAMALPPGRPSGSAVRLGPRWHAPLGGVLICACGAFSLTGFPLDDVWHRLFGQDVTLWGPTHLMLIGGAAMTLIGIAVLSVEGRRATAPAGSAGEGIGIGRLRLVALMGGLLLGLSTFQAEFDFGVPQFRFVFQPLLIMLAAGVGLVVARLAGGPGMAIGAVGFFLVIRGLIAVLVGPVLGQSTPHMPLYVAEALVVELVAWRVGARRPLAVGLWSGLGIGTIGLAVEWAWSHVWMPLPWPAELLPEAAVLGVAGAVGGAVIGAWVAHRLSVDPQPGLPAVRRAAVVAAATVAVAVGVALQKPAHEGVRAQVTLIEVRPEPRRSVHAEVTVVPRSAAADAEWLTVTAWQGGGLVVDRLRRIAPGRYRTTQPIPVHGSWKSLVRLHAGDALMAVPLYLPRDPAIPAGAVPARPRFERAFAADHEILQRESRSAAGWLTAGAYGVVAAIALSLLGLLAWGLHRLASIDARLPLRARWRGATTRRVVTR